jgi:putative transposase
MVRWLGILLRTLRSAVRTRRELALENLALRQQLAVWKARQPRPRLTALDRIFWVVLSRVWKSWRSSLHMVRPETVVGWHRRGFRLYWAWKSRRRWGRPAIGRDLRDLIRQMSRANPLWGAPRIHGELLKLGLTVSQAAVSKYMLRPRRPPSQAWRAFLKNHAPDLMALDFFTVPTATFRVLFVLVLLSHGRRRLVHFNVTEHPTAEWTARQLLEACGLEEEAAPRYLIRDRDQVYGERFSRQAKTLDIREAVIAPRSPWQNAYAERVIGSIRRECLDHVVVIGERHLLGILSKYVDYYNGTRTHLSLAKDAPESRSVQPPSQGRVVAMPRVGGLHHEYLRRAA